MQTLSVDQLVGQSLGTYRVERLMGQGRLSAVYFAQNTLTGMNGALTLFIVPEHFSQDARARFIQRFRKEATALTVLQHPHVLPVHEYGEYQGYPYLITPYMTNGSLADIVKREGRCEHTAVLEILEQVVAGLEYAHHKGVIHGTLKPSNIILGDSESMSVAGFGLMHMLQMRGVGQDDRPYGHLLSIADTFLAAPEYIAPEVVQGQSIDKRSDIYALGIILFELLSGKPPFTGSKPLDVAKMHVQQSLPSLRALHSDIPIAIVSVVNQALDRDPTRRFQSASELAEAFAQASVGATGSLTRSDQASRKTSRRNSDALPETPPQGYSTGSWQFMPPIVTGKISAIDLPANKLPSSSSQKAAGTTNSRRLQPSTDSEQSEAVDLPTRSNSVRAGTTPASSRTPQEPVRSAPPVKARVPAPPTLIPPMAEALVQKISAPIAQPEPLVWSTPPQSRQESRPEEKRQEWWDQSGQSPMILPNAEPNQWDTPAWSQSSESRRTRPTKGRSGNKSVRGRAGKNSIGRRKVVALLATGGVAVAGVLVGVKWNQSTQSTGNTATNQPPAKTTGATAANQPPAKTTGNTATNQPPAKTTGNTTAPTTTKNAPAKPPANVIGSKAMPLNTAVKFNNDQDLLIHLPNGNFVAYNRSCTHEGVPINYDPASKTMICPAHGAVFDPANNAKVLGGPAPSPVKSVKLSLNGDGTISMV